MKKDKSPGKWSISAEGHLGVGETYEHAAARELKEELGVAAKLELIFRAVYSVETETENYCAFRAMSSGPFRPDPDEVSDVRFFGLKELRKLLEEKPDMFSQQKVRLEC